MNSYLSQQTHTAVSDRDMQQFGARLAEALHAGLVLYLYGQLGAGKTTLVRGLLHGLGYRDKVKSPTYTLVEPYETDAFTIYHFDLYRINDPDELISIGIEEYFTKDAVCLVEWPDKGRLPAPDLTCYIEMTGSATTRQITIQAMTSSGDEALARL